MITMSNQNNTVAFLSDTSLSTGELTESSLVIGNQTSKPIQGALSEDQLTAINWSIDHRKEILQEQANARFTVSTTGSAGSRIADLAETVTLTVTAITKFKNDENTDVKVDVSTPPTGWSRLSEGTYSITTAAAAAPSVPQATFNYKVTENVSETYKGLNVSKKSTAVNSTVYYPAYYGYITTNNYSSLITNGVLDVAGKNLTRITTKKTDSAITLTNSTGSTAYFWILTHSTASASQSGNSILGSSITVKLRSFQPGKTGIVMENYHLYMTTNPVAADGSLDRVNLTINI